MAHLPDGTLRRLYDEPFAIRDTDRAHYAGCARCQERFQNLATAARGAQAALAVPGATVDADAALVRLQPRLAGQSPRPALHRLPRPNRAWALRLGAVAAAAAVSVTLVASGTAQTIIDSFQPVQLQVVPIASTDLVGLPDLSQFGDLRVGQQPELKEAASAQAAHALTGLPVIAPANLPSTVDVAKAQYGTLGQASGSFTFSAAKAQAYYASRGKTMPAMPIGMDGSTLSVQGGPAELVIYGDIPRPAAGGGEGSAGGFQLPSLAIGVTKAPVVTSTGVTVAQLKDYLKLLAPQLATAIDAVGTSSGSFPIPVPVDKVDQVSVRIGADNGVALGDNTGLGSAVVWETKGNIWAVGGTVTRDQAIAIANALKTS